MFRAVFCLAAVAGLAACGGSDRAHVSDRVKFSTAAYGVAASKRVTRSRRVRPGGGRRLVGKPYRVRGKWYRPALDPDYDRRGQASWYGPNFHGRRTANGEIYDQYALSAAHPTMPLPSYARVTNIANGESTIVRVNDRGPFHSGRIIDLSGAAAKRLRYRSKGVANVRVQYIGPAPLHGRDKRYLARSHKRFRVAPAAPSRPTNLGSRFILAYKGKRPAPAADAIEAAAPAR